MRFSLAQIFIVNYIMFSVCAMCNSSVSDFQFRKFLVIFFVFFVFGVGDTLSSDFEPGGKPDIKIINPDAEAVIGATLNIRERGSGLFGCGERRLDGVITADALKWMVDDLNKKIWSGTSANVSFGLYMMDSCGRTRSAASQLVEFLPELVTSEKFQRVPFKFCLIDDIGLGKEADVSKSLNDLSVHVIDTDVNVNSPQVLVNAILLFLQEFRWEHLAVVHSSSRFSSAMLKQFTKSLKKIDLCIPWVISIDDKFDSELQSVLKSDVPILSLLSSDEHSSFLKIFQEVAKPKKKVSVLFSDYVSRDQLKTVPAKDIRVFSVIPYPEKEVSFENYYAKNSIMGGVRTEDELDLLRRTNIVRKIKQIGKKLSEALRSAMLTICLEKVGLCEDLLSTDGRNSISQFLAKADWIDNELLYELVEYRYQFPEDHVHLHKIMLYNGHKNLEVFETNISFSNINCDGEDESRSECRCLEVKSVRSASGRNIDDGGRKKQRQSKHTVEKGKTPSAALEIQHVDQFPSKPMVFAHLNDPLTGTLACLTLLGGLVTLVIAQYFATFAALPNGGLMAGTSIIGYVILIGLFLLFVTNLSFLLTPLISTCALRRLCSAFSYAIVFSGMLIKVWSSLRQITNEKEKVWKPFTLLLYSGAFSLFQLLPSGLWLILKPPSTEYTSGKWVCYPFGDLDSHLLISMIYPVMLLLITLILAIRTCSKSNNDEARWILISSSLVAIIFCCWGVAIATGVWQVHRTPCTNLAAGTILMLCLYVPKIKTHSDLKKTVSLQGNQSQIPADVDKETSIFPAASPHFPVVLGYNVVAPILQENTIDPNYINQAYSIDESSETVSTPFDIDSSSYSDLEQEPYTFSTFLEDPQVTKLQQGDPLDDPTQAIPSALYPIEMFNNEPVAITSDHCQPGTNEFTPPHRTTSQLYLCPQPEWVP